jgi:replication factor A1
MQTDNELAPHIQDIAQVLEDKVEFELDEIETDLKKYTDVLSLPVDEAKRCIISNYLKSVKTDNTQNKYLAELSPNEKSVNLFCKVISINPKEVRVNGETKQIYYGLLSDQTGTLSFTAWNDFKLQKGDAVRISNAYTRDWQGNPELQFGDRTQIKKTNDELKTSNVPLNKIPTKARAPPKEYKVKEFQDGLSNISDILWYCRRCNRKM